MKQQINFRASDFTARQISELVNMTGLNQTEIVSISIDRMYTQEVIMQTNWYEKAESRVNRTPALYALRDVIMYDWPEGDEHWKWVATAPIKEIIDWAKTVKQGG